MRKTGLSIAAALFAWVAAVVPGATALPSGMSVQTYKSGLSFPVDMAWVPGTKKIFFTEKGGAVRVMVGRRLRARPCVELGVRSDGEAGLLGITLHPRFKKTKWLYVFYTNASPRESRVTRFKVDRNRCTNPRHVVTGLSADSGYHIGGQLEFVGGKLFVSVGDDHQATNAQDTSNRLGAILRVNADGSIPRTNPFGPTNAVWSYGHRNPFGLAKKPGTGKLFSTENGPSCDDELNRIRKGRNYGWGATSTCPDNTSSSGANPVSPLLTWHQIIVPTDPTWYRGRLKSLNGLLVGDYRDGQRGRIHRIVMNDDHTKVRRDVIVHDGSQSIIDVSKGPGGWLYFLTPSAIMRAVKS